MRQLAYFTTDLLIRLNEITSGLAVKNHIDIIYISPSYQ